MALGRFSEWYSTCSSWRFMKLSDVPGMIADYTIGTFIVITFLSTAEKRARRYERREPRAFDTATNSAGLRQNTRN